MSDKRLVEAFKAYIKLYNKEPEDYNELFEFNTLLSSISKTYDVTYDQINKDIILKYRKLIKT